MVKTSSRSFSLATESYLYFALLLYLFNGNRSQDQSDDVNDIVKKLSQR